MRRTCISYSQGEHDSSTALEVLESRWYNSRGRVSTETGVPLRARWPAAACCRRSRISVWPRTVWLRNRTLVPASWSRGQSQPRLAKRMLSRLETYRQRGGVRPLNRFPSCHCGQRHQSAERSERAPSAQVAASCRVWGTPLSDTGIAHDRLCAR